jgi:hypothetical protein
MNGLRDLTRNGMAEKLTAEKLNGDLQDLIRVMRARGDRPADHFVAGCDSPLGAPHAGTGPRCNWPSLRCVIPAQRRMGP